MEMNNQKHDEQRKQQIRAAATRCFVRRGYAATRLLDIAREAGLSKGGVYFHYRAKELLFHDIFEVEIEVLKQRWGFEPVVDQPADRTLVQVVTAHVRELEARPDETRLCNLLVTLAVQEQSFRVKLEQVFEVTRTLFAGIISRGIAEGVFTVGDPRTLAGGLVAMMQGLAAMSAVDPAGKLPMSAEEVATVALRMVGGDPAAAKPVGDRGVSASVEDAPAEPTPDEPAVSSPADETAPAPEPTLTTPSATHAEEAEDASSAN